MTDRKKPATKKRGIRGAAVPEPPADEQIPARKITDWFDRVFVINCAHRPDRLVEFREGIEETKGEGIEETKVADLDKITVVSAIIGDYTGHPAGWGGGNGAYGCLRSHQRVMEDLMHERDERGDMTWDSALILEDDVFFLPGALEQLRGFMLFVPPTWDQIYLGGQHRKAVVRTDSPHVVKATSVNRTHAYAVARHSVQKIYQHVSYMADYHSHKHIDHQMEFAHQRGDWTVYAPARWICGQRAGKSNISGQTTPDLTWQ